MKRATLTIPQTPLDAELARIADLKAEATKMLTALEEKATGQQVSTPGTWRHDPAGWLSRTKSK